MAGLIVVQMSAAVQPCQLIAIHRPEPVITEGHHLRPVYLQERLYGHVEFDKRMFLCSNCHEALHAWLYWLLGERKKPNPEPGRLAKAEAAKAYRWYLDEVARLGE